MLWIEGIGRSTDGFALETIEPQKGRHAAPLQQLSRLLKFARTCRTRITTDCATWTREDGQAFWSQLGIESLRPKDGQGLFKIVHDGQQYLIPAGVFISAMMRPIHRIHAFLFKPQGLECFCTPLLGDAAPNVGLYLPTSKVFGTHQTPTGLLAAYSWMHCFPSAHAMWSSVYLAACKGRLDIEPPKAIITMSLRSIRAGDTQLVTELTIMKLEAQEAPLEFAANHPRLIVMHESSGLDWQTLHQPRCTIPSRGDEWQLSEREWQAIEPMFAGREQTKFALRSIIDLILVKLGTGQAWRKLDFGALNFSIVQATYQRLQKRGLWPELEATLIALRLPSGLGI
jgi:hypothetical protein